MMKREDYKSVKHMSKAEMEVYLERIYKRGYEAGIKAIVTQLSGKTSVEKAGGVAEK